MLRKQHSIERANQASDAHAGSVGCEAYLIGQEIGGFDALELGVAPDFGHCLGLRGRVGEPPALVLPSEGQAEAREGEDGREHAQSGTDATNHLCGRRGTYGVAPRSSATGVGRA
jgi:hypothetical protein